MTHLEKARTFAESGEYERAYKITSWYLRKDPQNPQWLALMTYIMLGTDKPDIAYTLSKEVTRMLPNDAGAWMNRGMAASDLWRKKEAERSYKRGLLCSEDAERSAMLLVNLSSNAIDIGDYASGETYARAALEANPESVKASANLGFCLLSKREWAEGWRHYHKTVGCEWRPVQRYGEEPEWDGLGTGTIVLYSDQGIGDVICFCSMLDDILDWAEGHSTIIVEVEPKLANLIQRSFPRAVVYGTAGQQQLNWKEEHRHVDYSLPLGQAGEFFRTSDGQFERKPYLVPDPDREAMWRSLFQSKGKPVIGVAWTGGIPRNASHVRSIGLEQLDPLFRRIDAHWVSLQYTPGESASPVVEYPYGTLTNDYDDTAAMVAALDAVVSVPTSVVHLAGALGVRTLAMAAPIKCWKYASGLPFHPVTALIEHGADWAETIEETASYLEDLCITDPSSSVSIQDSPSPTRQPLTQSPKTQANP